MQLKININMDNEAFDHGNMKDETVRILTDIRDKVNFLGVPVDGTIIKANDANGNPVAEIKFIED